MKEIIAVTMLCAISACSFAADAPNIDSLKTELGAAQSAPIAVPDIVKKLLPEGIYIPAYAGGGAAKCAGKELVNCVLDCAYAIAKPPQAEQEVVGLRIGKEYYFGDDGTYSTEYAAFLGRVKQGLFFKRIMYARDIVRSKDLDNLPALEERLLKREPVEMKLGREAQYKWTDYMFDQIFRTSFRSIGGYLIMKVGVEDEGVVSSREVKRFYTFFAPAVNTAAAK